MLKPEAAKQQLKQWQIEQDEDDYGSVERFIPAIKKLPKALREIGFLLIDRDSKGEEFEDWELRAKFVSKQTAALESISKSDRTKLYTVFFGKMASDVENAWHWLKAEPYSSTPYRAPKSPEMTLAARMFWVTCMVNLAAGFRDDTLTPAWLAAWVPHIHAHWRDREVGLLLASVIDQGGKEADEVLDILCQSARKEHPIGAMGRHVTTGLLCSSQPEGWELMEKMLVAAQRQEGLRQVIFEAVTSAHPEAKRRMLRLVVDEKLARFSSVVQAADQWFGTYWSSLNSKKVNDTIACAADMLESSANCKKALAGKDAETAFLALWTMACEDAQASIKPAEKLLLHKSVEMRYVAALHLARIALPETRPARIKALEDEDIRVAICALPESDIEESEDKPRSSKAVNNKYFEVLERLLERMPAKPTDLEPLVWPWSSVNARRSVVGERMVRIDDIDPLRLLPHIKSFDGWDKTHVVRRLSQQKKWNAETRKALLDLAGDATSDVRETALAALAKAKLKPDEVERLESYLTRTATELRKSILEIVLAGNDKSALASAGRLLESRNKNQRLAGLEILRQLTEAGREADRCRELADEWRDSRRKLLKAEQSHLDTILATDRDTYSLDDGLGLLNPSKRSARIEPKKRDVLCASPSTAKLLKSLDDLVHKHRNDTVELKDLEGKVEKKPLGEMNYWEFPSVEYMKPLKKQIGDLPMREVWEKWHKSRPAGCKDKDGLEYLRANILPDLLDGWSSARDEFKQLNKNSKQWKSVEQFVLGNEKKPKLKYETIVIAMVNWFYVWEPTTSELDYCLDVLETLCASAPKQAVEQLRLKPDVTFGDEEWNDVYDWRDMSVFETYANQIQLLMRIPGTKVTKQHRKRNWQLLRWLDEPFDGAKRSRPSVEILLASYCDGIATLNDVADHLLGPDRTDQYGSESYDALRELTPRRPDRNLRNLLEETDLGELVDNSVERILEIELSRGETPTVVTDAALSVQAFRGTDTLLQILAALGKDGFKKLSGWRANTRDNRLATLTKLVGKTFPGEDDSPEDFKFKVKKAIADGQFPEERLLQLAFLAPQWTDFVEATVNWDGLAEGLYWYMAHMRYVWGMEEAFETEAEKPDDSDDSSEDDESDQPEKLSRWERLIRERTSLTSEERSEGAIDVAWFHRTYKRLKPKRWMELAAAAKFAATPAQAKRAQFIADVLLGKASKKDLVDGIRKRHLKENVRLLGLLPLGAGPKGEKDLADRYEVLEEYHRYAKQLSSMSRPEALRSVEIGMRNLASTAGYSDPIRLQWAMEAESTKDLAKGPVVVSKGDVSLTLSIDEEANPELTVRRGEKVLKSLPKTVNKDKKFVELRERNKHLKRQASRVKQSLETAMCRGDELSGSELMQLADHAILWPQLSRLVHVGEGIVGYPVKRGKALMDFAGKLEPIKKRERLRIAHPYDLLATKKWSRWQKECFASERLQPFKQVFRELYVVTSQEKKDKTFSARYAGQQVQPRQAYALWNSRSWSVDEYGNVFKAYPDEGIIVSLSFDYGITTPLEVEGLTIENVHYQKRDEEKPLSLKDVPPRIFSETMRDMDLVVSVAHVGDVDPEASASTVKMRTNLLRETCQLLKLKNVKLKDSRAMIQGQLGEYTVHLGSGVVHQMPGGAVCIVPVHSQHRGRLFLPFADDDPRTAEVVSKTLLLARDDEIDDPIILEQLRQG